MSGDTDLTDEEDWREINRPYKCSVIGCDKRYKNSNGIKYHNVHGHKNDILVRHPDGSVSLSTDLAVLKKLVMFKPYACETCGKRYKNYNGLKYHRKHASCLNTVAEFTGLTRDLLTQPLEPSINNEHDDDMLHMGSMHEVRLLQIKPKSGPDESLNYENTHYPN